MAAKVKTPSQPVRPLYEIAMDISKNWLVISPYAIPYVYAMRRLNKISDMYFQDSAKEIVLRFLSNASTWRGEKAREIKKELNAMCK